MSGFFVPRSKSLLSYCGLHRPLFSLFGDNGRGWGPLLSWCRRKLNLATHHPFFFVFLCLPLTGIIHRQSISRTVVRADSDEYAAQLDKMQKEAEERLDDKVEELMKNIETVGQSN